MFLPRRTRVEMSSSSRLPKTSRGDVITLKLEAQIRDAERRKADLLSSLQDGDDQIGKLQARIASSRSRTGSQAMSQRSRAGSARSAMGGGGMDMGRGGGGSTSGPVIVDTVETKAFKVLCAIDDYLRLRNFRMIDLFRR